MSSTISLNNVENQKFFADKHKSVVFLSSFVLKVKKRTRRTQRTLKKIVRPKKNVRFCTP